MDTLDRCIASVKTLLERIRQETGAQVPDIDWAGPGVRARVLMLASNPGHRGALVTNVLTPKNPDKTARNMQRLMGRAGLTEDVCVFWNAVPWALPDNKVPGSAEIKEGAQYLKEFISFFPELRVVVALGRAAQKCCDQAGITGIEVIEVCHPSDRGLRGGGRNEEEQHVAGLRRAALMAARS